MQKQVKLIVNRSYYVTEKCPYCKDSHVRKVGEGIKFSHNHHYLYCPNVKKHYVGMVNRVDE